MNINNIEHHSPISNPLLVKSESEVASLQTTHVEEEKKYLLDEELGSYKESFKAGFEAAIAQHIIFVQPPQTNTPGEVIKLDFENETTSIQFPRSVYIRTPSEEDAFVKGLTENKGILVSTAHDWDTDDLGGGVVINEFFGFSPPRPDLNAKKELKKILAEVELADKFHMVDLIDKKMYKVKDTYYLYLFFSGKPISEPQNPHVYYTKITHIITPSNAYTVSTNYRDDDADKDNHEEFLKSLIITPKANKDDFVLG